MSAQGWTLGPMAGVDSGGAAPAAPPSPKGWTLGPMAGAAAPTQALPTPAPAPNVFSTGNIPGALPAAPAGQPPNPSFVQEQSRNPYQTAGGTPGHAGVLPTMTPPTEGQKEWTSRINAPEGNPLENIEQTSILAGAGILGSAAGTVESAVGRQLLSAGDAALSGYFAYQSGKGAVSSVKAAKQAYDQGDTLGAFRQLGTAGLEGFFAWAAGQQALGRYQQVADISKLHNDLQADLNARQAARDQGAGPRQLPAPAAPPAAPADITAGWTKNPIEDAIAEQERAAIIERKANYPLPPKPAPPVPAAPVSAPSQPPAAVAQQPQAAQPAPPEIAKGWTVNPMTPEDLGHIAAQQATGGSPDEPALAPAQSTALVPGGPPQPGGYADLPPSAFTLDPNRFQFKFEGVGQKGVTGQFKDVEKWNPDLSGTVHAWYDPEDGETYPINGHHRVELGQRLGDEDVPGGIHTKYIEAADAQEARGKGALINIGEGQGTALDIGKYMRDTGLTEADLKTQHGIVLHKKAGQQGAALAQLTDPIFHDVVHGILPVERAAILGAGVPNQADQTAIYTLMRQREAGGKRLTNDQLDELIRMNQRTSTVTENPDGQAQGSMFDLGEMTRSLLPEKAIVSDYVRGQLRAERKLFGAVSTQAAAERLGQAGNVIQAGTNAQTAQAANQGSVLYDKLSTSTGPIDDVLDKAAQRIASGENANGVKQDAYTAIRDHLTTQLQALTGTKAPDSGIPQAVGEGRVDQAPPRESHPLDASGTGVDDAGRAGAVRAAGEPALSAKVEPPAESGGEKLPTSLPDLLAGAQATAVPKSGAQLVGGLRVNEHAAEVLRQAHELGGGERMGSFDGAATYPRHVLNMQKGLDGMARSAKLPPQARQAAAALAAELKKASAGGQRGVAIAEPGAESHEHIHFAVDNIQFDPETILAHGETLRAVIQARSTGLARGSNERVIREVITRILNREHGTVKLDEAAADRVLVHFLANSAHDEPGLATLKELAHEQFKDTIGNAAARSPDTGTAVRGGEEPGTPPDHRARPRGAGGDGRVGPDEAGDRSQEEGPQLSSRNLDLFGGDEDNAAAERAAADRLTGDRLTAQFKSGGAVKPSNLKPAQNRGLFDEDKPESGNLFGSERGSISLKPIQQTPEQLKAAADKRYGENVREWFTARRDVWAVRVHQAMDQLRQSLPAAVDREGLYLMRDFRNKPGELKQWLDGTHAGYGEVPRLDIARENVEKLRGAIERALDPTPAMEAADKQLTHIAQVSLDEGQRLGFIDHHVSPDEYVTHLLGADEEGQKPSLADRMGKAMGGKIGLNFPFNQERAFPTILEAIANNQRPKTIDALKAFDTYGDKFAEARATHMLRDQLHDSDTGVWGSSTKSAGVPKGWVEIAPHARLFRKEGAYITPEGEPVASHQVLFVPPKIEQGLRPITDPDYMNKVKGFAMARAFQAYTKAAQLGLSFFHATTENYMALANMGPSGWLKGLQADRNAPGFLEQEADFVGHGGTTSMQGKTYEAAEGLTFSSLPTAGEAWRSLPGIHQVDQAAQKITDFTFGKLQRQFKVTDYALHKAAWLAEHPDSMPMERTAAMRSMAKEINAVYGGLHLENLGINKMTADVGRALLLAPDWTFSNVFNVKYAAETGTPAGKMARAFWLRAIIGGMAATQLMSLLMSGKLSKRPTQVHLGTDKDGKEIYQNLFFKGAPGDIANLIGNIKDYDAVEGLARTVGNKAAPVLRTGIEAMRNENFLGRPIVPKGMNTIAGTVRGATHLATGLAPVPWSIVNMKDMLFGPESHKYKVPLEVLTTLFAGTPPSHVGAPKAEKPSQSVWNQILTGKIAAPAEKRVNRK